MTPRRSFVPILLALLLLGAGGAPRSALAQQPGIQQVNGGIQLNFQDLDLAFVFTALAQTAGLNLIYHDLPSKAITLRTTQPMAVAEIPALIRSLARANGVGVTEEGGFLRLQGVTAAADETPDLRELYIHRLQHARAPILAQTLQALFGGAAPSGTGFTRPQTLSQQLNQIQQVGQGAQAGVVQAPVFQLQQGSGELEGNVLIVPDEVTNSLLVRATPGDWVVLQQALQALDLRPLQVVIEVIIAEVRRTEDLDIGTTFSGTRTTGDGTITGTLERETPPANAFSLDLLRTGNLNVEATLTALAATGDVRILSRPVVLAQNNQEARILVGSQRPFVQVSRTLPTDQGARDEVIQYRDVGTVLTILPTINEDGYVNLQLVQEVSSATTETQFGAPIISSREATTQLLARHGQTVVVGGLVDRQEDEIRSGIPILKDIPILGYLFGYTRSVAANAELFLFLTPYIVATDEDADLVRETIEQDAELIGPILPERTLTPPVPAPGAATPTPAPDASGTGDGG